MLFFDFNIHLPFLKSDNVNDVIHQDLNLNCNELIKGFETHLDKINKCTGANFLLFNTKLFNEDVSDFFNLSKSKFEKSHYTALVDFRDENVNNYIDNLKASGVNAIMFNSYLQQISENEFPLVIKACQYASKKNLIVCIDGSYGTSKMYAYDNMKLVCLVADEITDTPIVIVHSGGYRVMEAMLLAADKKNVWLDTSFSLPYYINSSIEQDFAFVLKQLNCDRIVFGSDHPYMEVEQTLAQHLTFFKKHNFTEEQQQKIFFQNAFILFP